MARTAPRKPRSAPPPPEPPSDPAPAPIAWGEWRAPYLIPLVLLALTRGLAWFQLPYAAEDAYITFRYARNLAVGHGLVYNPNERVMGFSSPLWTLWCALGTLLLHDPVAWSRATGTLCDLATLVLVTRLLERFVSRAAAWCFALFFALWPYFSVVAVTGMEIPLLAALIALGATLAGRRSLWTGPALGALALTRPEGLAAAFVIGLWARGRDRLVALAIAAAGIGGLWAYFGSPVPQSVVAKSQLYGTPGPWAGRVWWDWIVPLRLGDWPSIGDINALLPLVVVLAAAGWVGAGALWAARRTPVAAAGAAALTVWAGYIALGVAFFFWYFEVPLLGVVILAACGLPRLVRGRAVYVSILLYVLGDWSIGRILYVGRARAEAGDFGRISNYLTQNAHPGQSVLLEPIGFVGYYNPLRILDEVGLVTPAVARRRMQGAGWYTDIVSSELPDWLVMRRAMLEKGRAFAGAGLPFRGIAERDSLLARYTRVDTGNESSGDQAFLILKRER